MTRWVPVIIYAGILFYLSSLHHPRVPQFWFSDKLLHVLFYAGFGVVWVRAFEAWRLRWSSLKIILVAIVGCLAYGLTDEYHQLFVAARSAERMDIVADGIGGFLGGGFYLLVHYVVRFRRRGKIQTDNQAVAPF